MKSSGLFYREKPLFGFDIGHGSIKIVQLDRSGKKINLIGYGRVNFDPKSIQDGVIVDYETITKAARELFEKHLTGSISTRHVAVNLPVLNSYSRIINLPKMDKKDILEAIRTEAAQSIPVPLDDLYLDYQLVEQNIDTQDFLIAASPKKVVDSFMTLFDKLGLEPAVLEPSILSVTRIVKHAEESSIPTLVIDCGSITTDLTVFNKSSVRVTGTIKFGGETITDNIMNKFGVSYSEAYKIKSVYGLDPSKKQNEMINALSGSLQYLTSEIQKITRYFEERDKDQNVKVEQIVLLGGGANLPGFSTYLTSALRTPTRLISIWEHISLDHIEKPNRLDNSMYGTAAGLALVDPKEVAK
jgi:type IV pilus assembly protein PilM